MNFNLSKSLVQAASAGLMLGAVVACGGNQAQPETPASAETAASSPAPGDPETTPAAGAGGDQTAAGAGAKECCKGKNECKGKGGCKGEAHSCAGQNECKGKGGCNGHCPK